MPFYFDAMLMILAVVALLGRVGLALYATGLVRSKNSAGTITRVLCDLCVGSLAFWAIGGALLLQKHPSIIGIDRNLIFGWIIPNPPNLFFHLTIVLLASGVVVGAVAERFKFFPLCIASAVLAGIVLPITGGCVWYGWLGLHGFIDIGGATAMHVAAGAFAAVAAMMVGPRNGKFNKDGSSTMIPGHSVPFAALGAIVMIVAWTAALSGRAILAGETNGPSMAALSTVLAASAAGLSALVLGQFRYGKPDVILAIIGLLGGLAAISGGAGTISTAGAVLTGIVAGALVPVASVFIDLRLRIDDPSGLIAVHLIGGAWGTIAAGLFGRLANTSHLAQFGRQIVGMVVVASFAAIVSALVFGLLKMSVGIRAREADEFDGLDLAEHDIGAYPDFQQTMIKSYHLREV
ncbi:MAG TPA: hypothetical protein VH370_04345 [Humisphaera sp.]|jgi:Amt family ammonium transporter|nr:hypothetical protein [Humisphaera sp.]